MSRHCQPHNIPEPCYYCEKGLPSFETLTARIQTLEDRVRELETGDRTLLLMDRNTTNYVVRMGGVGDIIILTSSLKALKEQHPDRPLVLATLGDNIPLLENAPFIDGLVSVSNWGDAKFRHKFDLRYAVEPPGIGEGKLPWDDYMTRDRSDLFDRLLGVKSKKEFYVPVDKTIVAAMLDRLSTLPRPFIGIAATSKSPVRTIPPEYIEPLARLIKIGTGGTVFIFGVSVKWNQEVKEIQGSRIINMVDSLNLREAMAFISIMDLIVGADSAPVHAAGALKVPCLALFGNIHPRTRVTYYPTVKALFPEGELPCIPCWDKTDLDCREGKFGGPCMRLFTPDRIMAELKNVFP